MSNNYWPVKSPQKIISMIKKIIWKIMGFAEIPTIKENDKHDSDLV